MDKIKKIILFRIPMSICNLRCHYCYLSQRPVHFEGIQPEMKYAPEQVGYALRAERIGGKAYINLCADGETLLVKDIDKYVKALTEQGHYVKFVTNLTVTPVLLKILSLPKSLLSQIEFKCSFHYLELKAKGKLELFADNVNKIWEAGASANIEVTPSDELVPYIPELKEFSLNNFGALPHLTIARDDRTNGIDYLTSLPMVEYDKIWGEFDSDFWKFKKTIFGKKQKDFCYAGQWGMYVDLTTGEAKQCYCGKYLGNVFENPDTPLPEEPIGKCPIAHCYNGHMLLTLGYIPNANMVYYGDIRDRVRPDGFHWLNPRVKEFFNSKLESSNNKLSLIDRRMVLINNDLQKIRHKLGAIKWRLANACKNGLH